MFNKVLAKKSNINIIRGELKLFGFCFFVSYGFLTIALNMFLKSIRFGQKLTLIFKLDFIH
ncbi:MAG TPA: hypothetical protein DHV48_14005 [Prolixibacteraceae bacterium]|nr:hypothetical protein [Prolixibacteraceae bacterium]